MGILIRQEERPEFRQWIIEVQECWKFDDADELALFHRFASNHNIDYMVSCRQKGLFVTLAKVKIECANVIHMNDVLVELIAFKELYGDARQSKRDRCD